MIDRVSNTVVVAQLCPGASAFMSPAKGALIGSVLTAFGRWLMGSIQMNSLSRGVYTIQ